MAAAAARLRRWPPPLATLAALAVLAVLTTRVLSKDALHSLGKDALLESEEDVWFEALSERELREHWSFDDGSSLEEKISRMEEFNVTVHVQVQLIGFSGEGNGGVNVNEQELLRFLDALPPADAAYVAHAEPRGAAHRLPFRTKVVFSVGRAAQSTTTRLQHVLNEAVPRGTPPGSRSVIPVEAIDTIVQAEFHKSGLTYSLFILNPVPPSAERPAAAPGEPPTRVPLQYVYRQPEPGQRVGERGTNAEGCAVQGWVSSERYAWLDLTAGPVSYGPQTAGEGILTEFSVPRVFRGPVHDASAPSNSTRQVSKHELLAELAATVHRSSQLLFNPTLHRFPLPYRRHIAVNIIVITDSPREEDGAGDEPKSGGVDQVSTLPEWLPVARELKGLALAGQRVEVLTQRINFFDCELCVLAYTHSLNSHTSNVLSNGLRTQVHQYLDSSEMRDWLEHFETNFWTLAETTTRSTKLRRSDVRVVNAFVYELKTREILLLDRFHQAVAFKDMVIAVKTQAPSAVVDYSCNGKSVQFSPQSPERAVLAALLQTVWGVSPTHQLWNPLRNRTEHDFTWTIGPTPFGYISSSTALSFSIKDATARHALLSDVHAVTREIGAILKIFAEFRHEIEDVVTPQHHLQFVRRWNVVNFKLNKAKYFMSLANFRQAVLYLRSARHDTRALHELVRSTVARPLVVCEKRANPRSGLSRGAKLALLAASVALFLFGVSQSHADSWLLSKLWWRAPKTHYY